MKIETPRTAFLGLLRLIGIIALVLVVIVVVIGLVLGWQEQRDYGFALMLAGVAAWMLGGGSMMGTLSTGGDARYQYARTFSPNTTLDRMRQDVKDRTSGKLNGVYEHSHYPLSFLLNSRTF